MARIAGVDLPRNKRIEISLTYIYGVGRTLAHKICEKASVGITPRLCSARQAATSMRTQSA